MVDGPEQIVAPEVLAAEAAATAAAEAARAGEKITTPEPLTAEKLEQTLTNFLERAEKSIQSAKDKAIGEVQRRAPQPGAGDAVALQALRAEFADLDPEVADKMEVKFLRAQARAREASDAEGQRTAASQSFAQQFNESLTAMATDAGLDPKDKNLDWAEDAGGDFLTRMGRFQKSVVKTLLAKAGSATTDAAAQLKADEIEKRKKAGLESHDTAIVAGDSTALGDDEFLKAFGDANTTIPLTKANVERAERIMKAKNTGPLSTI